ncbi:MAG: DeoR/GlpR transcriptional regulator [Phycisphaerae bacterium]|nr:DeoR/GlpR transcriptional regulator [Phycisphaerae bacterium]
MGLLAEKRYNYILTELRNNGKILVGNIAKTLGVTEVTIRRDLLHLQKDGLLKKTYGGAVLSEPDLNTSTHFRQTRNLKAKKIIGKLASELIEDGDILYFEAGTTCYEILPYLDGYKDLTIIVNSLYLMSGLHEMANHKVIIIGGQYRPERMDMVGPTAEATISQLGGFKAFTGADDISIHSGISGADVVTVGFAKLILQRASQVVFVGDHTKFNKPALYKIADIDHLDYIVTDIKPSDQWLKTCEQNNIKLIHPDDKAQSATQSKNVWA